MLFLAAFLGGLTASTAQVVRFSHSPGLYDGPFWLKVTELASEYTVFYTLDGSEPNTASAVLSDSILIDLGAREHLLHTIPTSDSWELPELSEPSAVVFRWMAQPSYSNIQHRGAASFLMEVPSAFPVISIITDSLHFFSEQTGIYVAGNGAVLNYHQTGREWERPIEVDYFNTEGVWKWQQKLGARINGRSSRSNPQKSLRLYARSEYGANFIRYPFFGVDEQSVFKRMILRVPERYFSNAIVLDEAAHRLVATLNLESNLTQPVQMLINGESWGVANMRERMDEWYLALHFNVDDEKVDIVEWDLDAVAEEGNLEAYNALMDYLKSENAADPMSLERLNEWIDLDNFIEYLSVQSILANKDWPANNIRMWRERKPGARWRFFFYDADGCFADAEWSPIDWITRQANDGNPVSFIVDKWKDQSAFINPWLERMHALLENELSAEKMLEALSALESMYAPVVMQQSARWHNPENVAEWKSALTEAQMFASRRAIFLKSWIQETMDRPFSVYPQPVRDVIQIHFKSGTPKVEVKVGLYNLSGQELPLEVDGFSEGKWLLPLTKTGSGVHVLHVQYGGLHYFEKIVVLD